MTCFLNLLTSLNLTICTWSWHQRLSRLPIALILIRETVANVNRILTGSACYVKRFLEAQKGEKGGQR